METGREAWLLQRKSGIGGSDAAAILGLSRWATGLDVWLEKRGELPAREDNPALWWGRELEPVIVKRYEMETGRALWDPAQISRHATIPFLIGTPDRLVIDRKIGVEIKTTRPELAHLWGEAGTDDIPTQYAIQCCHYMMVKDFDEWDAAVLIGGSDFRRYRLLRDAELEETMRDHLVAWWERHMVKGERPEMGDSVAIREWIGSRFPTHSGTMIAASPGVDAVGVALREAREMETRAAKARAIAENAIKEAIGENLGIKGGDWRATWKTVKGRTTVDLDRLRELTVMHLVGFGGTDALVAEARAREIVEAVFESSKVQSEPYRRFTYSDRGGR